MEKIGHVFHMEGIYEPDEIVAVLVEGKESPQRTDFVIVNVDGKEVLFQVVSPLFEYEGFGYEKEAIQKGMWEKTFDDDKLRRAIRARQIGFFDEYGNLQPFLNAIPPMSPVYLPPKEKIESIILPSAEYKLKLGKRYPKEDIEIYVDLERVLRQGLLITGGVGTGKTTTLGSILYNLLRIEGLNPKILLIDPDGELGSEDIINLANEREGYVQISCDKKSDFVRSGTYNVKAFKSKFEKIFNLAANSKIIKTISECASSAQKDDVPLTMGNFRTIVEKYCINNETKEEILSLWDKYENSVLSKEKMSGGINIPDLVKRNTIVHIDGSTTPDFNNFLYASLVALESCFNEVIRDKNFGLVAIIDEAHLLAPQFSEDQIGDSEIHKELTKLLKSRIATTGPRNGMSLWLTTQRLAKLDKTLSTQTGQNLIAHSCEDVDFKRLSDIVGYEYARSAKFLPKGHALVKSAGLKLRGVPILIHVKKEINVKSSETSLIKRWKKSYEERKQKIEDAKSFI